MKTVLSIDGGGMRGIIPAKVISWVEQNFQGSGEFTPAYKLFDYIAGTSTGGIIALGLTKPNPLSGLDLANLYRNEGSKIFSSSAWYKLKSMGSVNGPKYPSDGIESVLKEKFDDASFWDAATNVLITSYDIRHRVPRFFKSWVPIDKYYKIRDIARATSAAPTFFPPIELANAKKEDLGYDVLIDGGVFANNPTMCVLADILSQEEDEDVLVLSLGTGNTDRPIEYNDASSWGLVGWSRPLIEILIDGVSDSVDYEVRRVIENRKNSSYTRVQLPDGLLSKDSKMDDTSASAIAELNALADKLIDDNKTQLRDFCLKLKAAGK